jgi:hypothetical protein
MLYSYPDMIDQPKLRFFNRILLGIVILLLILSFIPTSGGPFLEVLVQEAGIGAVKGRALEHLREQREQALEGFLVLSALKVGLAILKSSEVGLILNVRIGDLAVAIYDYVNFGWKVLLAAVAYYYLAEFLLDLAGTVDIWFIWVALVCSGFLLILTTVKKEHGKSAAFFSKTGIAAFVFSLILYLGLPLAFVGAGWVSVHITGGTIKDANQLFKELEDGMPGILEGDREKGSGRSEIRTPSVTVPVPYDGTDPSQVIIDDPRRGKGLAQIVAGLGPTQKLIELRNYLEERSRSLASAVLHQTAAYLFNIVVFPLLTILALYWCGKHILTLGGPVASSSRDSAVLPDVRRISEAVTRLEKAAGEWKHRGESPRDPGSGNR